MISTTQMRILRTLQHTSPPTKPSRLARTLVAPSWRIPLQQPPCATPRLLSTSNPSRQKTPQHQSRRDNEPNNNNNKQTHNTRTTQHVLSPAAANPPPTTRPPPLDLPARSPDTSTIKHLFATGKAYLSFYKTGLRHIYINTRLVWSLSAAAGIPPDHTPPGTTASPPTLRPPPGGTTRSAVLLGRRWRHDARRLPLFALLLLVCGEFTPFVVLAVPGVVPLTCRIPQQVEKLRRRAADRRAASFGRLSHQGRRSPEGEGEGGGGGGAVAGAPADVQQACRDLAPAAVTAHVARSLNLIASLWDRAPLSLLPDSFVSAAAASRRVRQHLRFLDRDNHLLHQAGGVGALEEDEVLLACEDRGIWPVGTDSEEGANGGRVSNSTTRVNLQRWLHLVSDDEGLVAGRNDPWSAERAAEREARMVVLMMTKEWPGHRRHVRAAATILLAKGE